MSVFPQFVPVADFDIGVAFSKIVRQHLEVEVAVGPQVVGWTTVPAVAVAEKEDA
jgi:hypothetical protein